MSNERVRIHSDTELITRMPEFAEAVSDFNALVDVYLEKYDVKNIEMLPEHVKAEIEEQLESMSWKITPAAGDKHE